MSNTAIPMQPACATSTAFSPGQSPRRLYFFNERLPEAARNVHHVHPTVQKLGILIGSETPWGTRENAMSFCSSLVRLDDGTLRMYYTARAADLAEMWIAVAESSDGLAWQRPALKQHPDHNGRTNRLVIEGVNPGEQAGQPQVFRMTDGMWLMYFWHHIKNGYRYAIATSRDGLRWAIGKPPAFVTLETGLLGRWPLLHGWTPEATFSPEEARELWALKPYRANDACNVYFNPFSGLFEYYGQWLVPAMPGRRVEQDNLHHANRFIQRRTSLDGVTWSEPELVIRPGARDPWDLQFYHLAIQWHEDWMIGSLGHYRVENEQQTMDLELVFSRTGREWQRPLRGGFIPRAPATPGAADSQGIYPPTAWLDEGDTWLCHYQGVAHKHNRYASPGNHEVEISGARWAKNRFVGLAAARGVTGGFLSDPFCLQSECITIDADIRGWLRAELCDTLGNKLDGFHLMDSIPVQGDRNAHPLRWKNSSTAPFRHDIIRVRFEYCDGDVYSIGFAPS